MARNDDNDLPNRRRYSLWSLLAPIALVVVVFAMYSAVHDSGVVEKGSGKAKTAAKAKAKAKTVKHTCQVSRGHRVREGETSQSIERDFCLTHDQLVACNPNVIDFSVIPTGLRLNVGKKACAKAAAKPKTDASLNDL
jgi:hypothetical protein